MTVLQRTTQEGKALSSQDIYAGQNDAPALRAPLSRVKGNGVYIITACHAQGSARARLDSLGLVVGAVVRVRSASYAGVIVDVKGSRLAICKSMADELDASPAQPVQVVCPYGAVRSLATEVADVAEAVKGAELSEATAAAEAAGGAETEAVNPAGPAAIEPAAEPAELAMFAPAVESAAATPTPDSPEHEREAR